jgi:enoyl-CoA hydratase/carnithine racemase
LREEQLAYENIQTEARGRVVIIRLNRPKALNALCAELVRELGLALDACEADPVSVAWCSPATTGPSPPAPISRR